MYIIVCLLLKILFVVKALEVYQLIKVVTILNAKMIFSMEKLT